MNWFTNLFKKPVAKPAPPITPPIGNIPPIVPIDVPTSGLTPEPEKKVYGIDIYHGDIINSWQELAKSIDFIFLKATEGASIQDSQLNDYRYMAKDAGITTGFYHFYRSNRDPIVQAKSFLQKIGSLYPGDLPPVLDWETEDDTADGPDIEEIRLWLDYVEGKLGVTPIIYSGSSFIGDKKLPPSFRRYPFWVAHYTKKDSPKVPFPWKDFTFWQKTDSQIVSGVKNPCDYNVFNGSLDQLKALCKK